MLAELSFYPVYLRKSANLRKEMSPSVVFTGNFNNFFRPPLE